MTSELSQFRRLQNVPGAGNICAGRFVRSAGRWALRKYLGGSIVTSSHVGHHFAQLRDDAPEPELYDAVFVDADGLVTPVDLEGSAIITNARFCASGAPGVHLVFLRPRDQADLT